MGYLHINNLYRDQDILLFKECYAMEKIHGTSSHVLFNVNGLTFFSGGESHTKFLSLFNQEELLEKMKSLGSPDIVIYGEAYGGSQQGMSATYGKQLKFIAFDVKINDIWLSVPDAEQVCKDLGIEFVWYTKSTTDIDGLNKLRDIDSPQAIRNGVGEGKKMEGVVLRPLIELTKNNGSRIIVKHKRDEFKETKTPREVSPEALKVLEDANHVADEWVTLMRLNHVLDKLPGHDITQMQTIIKAMIEDVCREGEGEFVDSPEARKAIGKKAAQMYKEFLQASLLTK